MIHYMKASEYCDATGLPRSQMDRCLHCNQHEEFSYRSGAGQTSAFYIMVEIFEKKMARGDFREVLEG